MDYTKRIPHSAQVTPREELDRSPRVCAPCFLPYGRRSPWYDHPVRGFGFHLQLHRGRVKGSKPISAQAYADALYHARNHVLRLRTVFATGDLGEYRDIPHS
jgi:hypothetical protein